MPPKRKFVTGGGYPKEIFVNEVNEDFICGICLDVLKDPHQCEFGHMMCKYCFERSLEIAKICPICKVEIDVNHLSMNLAVKNMIGRLNVRCSCTSNACEWRGNLNERLVRDCDFSYTLCGYVGCTQRVLCTELVNHMKKCGKRLTLCKHCSLDVTWDSLTTHQESCSHRMMVCECKLKLKFFERTEHRETVCPEVEVDCPLFAEYHECAGNCGGHLKRGGLPDHLGVHSGALIGSISEFKTLQHKCSTLLTEQAEHVAKLQACNASLMSAVERAELQHQELASKVFDLESQIVVLTSAAALASALQNEQLTAKSRLPKLAMVSVPLSSSEVNTTAVTTSVSSSSSVDAAGAVSVVKQTRDHGEYTGIVVNGIRHGHGYMKYTSGSQSGSVYNGDCLNNMKHGHGVLTAHQTGEEYTGFFQLNKFHGEGQMTYKNGDVYVGQWASGVKSGIGELSLQRTNCCLQGNFVNDNIYVGSIKYNPTHSRFGCTYLGNILHNKPHGFGTMTEANGDQVSGNWRRGLRPFQAKTIKFDGACV